MAAVPLRHYSPLAGLRCPLSGPTPAFGHGYRTVGPTGLQIAGSSPQTRFGFSLVVAHKYNDWKEESLRTLVIVMLMAEPLSISQATAAGTPLAAGGQIVVKTQAM